MASQDSTPETNMFDSRSGVGMPLAAMGVTLLCLLCAVVAVAQTPAPTGETISLELPREFEQTPVFQDIKPDKGTFEHVPSGQTAREWNEKITVQVVYKRGDLDPKKTAESFQANWRRLCATFQTHDAEIRPEKDYPTTIVSLDCINPDRTKAPADVPLRAREFVMYKLIRGKDSFYMVQRAWHGDAGQNPPPLADQAARENWVNFFRSVEICDSRIKGQTCRGMAQN